MLLQLPTGTELGNKITNKTSVVKYIILIAKKGFKVRTISFWKKVWGCIWPSHPTIHTQKCVSQAEYDQKVLPYPCFSLISLFRKISSSIFLNSTLLAFILFWINFSCILSQPKPGVKMQSPQNVGISGSRILRKDIQSEEVWVKIEDFDHFLQ